jgi:hypothetical protein
MIITKDKSIYTIRAKTHSELFEFYPSFKSHKEVKRVIFTKSCLYIPEKERDWNKLFGWSYGLHHNNSVRIGWRAGVNYYEEDTRGDAVPVLSYDIELCLYLYQDGHRYVYPLPTNIDIEKGYMIELEVKDKEVQVIVTLDNKKIIDRTVSTPKLKTTWWGYKLFPYFGGQEKAPHNMVIYLRDKNV